LGQLSRQNNDVGCGGGDVGCGGDDVGCGGGDVGCRSKPFGRNRDVVECASNSNGGTTSSPQHQPRLGFAHSRSLLVLPSLSRIIFVMRSVLFVRGYFYLYFSNAATFLPPLFTVLPRSRFVVCVYIPPCTVKFTYCHYQSFVPLSPDPIACPCDIGIVETRNHILRECPRYNLHRNILFSASNHLTLTELLGTKRGIKALAEFIQMPGAFTRTGTLNANYPHPSQPRKRAQTQRRPTVPTRRWRLARPLSTKTPTTHTGGVQSTPDFLSYLISSHLISSYLISHHISSHLITPH